MIAYLSNLSETKIAVSISCIDYVIGLPIASVIITANRNLFVYNTFKKLFIRSIRSPTGL